MVVLMMGVIVAVLCVGLLMVASVFIRLDEATCVECGSQLPIVHPLARLENLTGSWACSRCGRRFDSHGKVAIRITG